MYDYVYIIMSGVTVDDQAINSVCLTFGELRHTLDMYGIRWSNKDNCFIYRTKDDKKMYTTIQKISVKVDDFTETPVIDRLMTKEDIGG